jgi:hypothetical protein
MILIHDASPWAPRVSHHVKGWGFKEAGLEAGLREASLFEAGLFEANHHVVTSPALPSKRITMPVKTTSSSIG